MDGLAIVVAARCELRRWWSEACLLYRVVLQGGLGDFSSRHSVLHLQQCCDPACVCERLNSVQIGARMVEVKISKWAESAGRQQTFEAWHDGVGQATSSHNIKSAIGRAGQ